MTSNQRNTAVLMSSFGVMAAVSAVYFEIVGLTAETLDLMLRLSARIALIVLLVIFVARPLRQMFPVPGTATLLRNRRLFGIAFAGIHVAHFGVLLIKNQVVPDFGLFSWSNALGAFIYAVILALLVTSWNAPARAIGQQAWKILHKAGLYVLFIAFSVTQLPYPEEGWDNVNWWMLAIIAIAIVIRLTAFFAKRTKAQPQ